MYIFEINSLSVASFAIILSHSEGCFLTLLIVSFVVQKLLSLIRFHLYTILYIENPKDSTRKLLELNNEYSKVEGYKINTQKPLSFLYPNNEKTEREIKETIPFTIAMKRIRYLGIYLPKETKDLYIYIYISLASLG